MSTQPAPSVTDLQERLSALGLRDERRLSRRLADLQRKGCPDDQLARLVHELAGAEQRVAVRRAAVPELHYPEQLPVSQVRGELAAAIGEHQVVVVAGETGSGKTTQLPKICLELGRGVRGLIGHTQPRRIAARSVAERIAEEIGSEVGGLVGYKVRFTDQVGPRTLVKLMTDGMLLAEVQNDRDLLQYDTLIVDEAHERSLTIDFLLGYLTQLLPRRPDLKVVITSATIDPDRFSRHFGGAPVVEVSGRTFPVEVRYRPPAQDVDPVQAVIDAVDELAAEPPGDVLVFLSGEREIRDTADALRRSVDDRTEVLPLYGRLSAAEQHRVFEQSGKRRVVLATNVAETSLTVPGIRYVVDPGTARISRFNQRTKVQRLPIEAISRASAEQRKGRCGRVADGVCIRLYDEEDLLARPEFTDPEVLRTSLASVILAMAALRLGDVADFPFLDPPDSRQVRDGVQLLGELGALRDGELSQVGRQLAQLPVDPRLARMVVEANRLGCLREVLVIVSALSIQDPRERPTDKQEQANQLHARFRVPGSDPMSYVSLWDHLREQQRELSGNAFRRMCKSEFLHYLRVREWQDVHSQLRRTATSLGFSSSEGESDADSVHQAMLAGLLSHIGLYDPDKRDYLGARGARFSVVPGSALFKKATRFVVAAELVETNRLWGRVVAKVEPEWAEKLAPHLVMRSWSEPHWERKRGAVMAYERVLLYGVPLVARRKVAYSAIDPALCRDLFLRHALVEGDWETHHAFFAANRELLEEVEELEHRARRRDIVVSDQALYEFYDSRLPEDVVSAGHFDAWWKKTRRSQPDLLTFTPEVLAPQGALVALEDYPDCWLQGELQLCLSYQFEPGGDADGVTVHIPLPVLNRVRPDGFDWQVPGLREQLVTALIKSLPKAVRRHLVPAPDHARGVLARVSPEEGPLLDALTRGLSRHAVVPPDGWDTARVPDHLRVTFRVEDGDGAVGAGKDLAALQAQLAPRVRTALASAAPDLARTGLTAWPGGALPRTVARGEVKGYPALVDEGSTVGVRVLGTPAEQRLAMARGTRRLLSLVLPDPVKAVQGRLTNGQRLALAGSTAGAATVLADCALAALDVLVAEAGGPAWDEDGFAVLLDAVKPQLPGRVLDLLAQVTEVLTLRHELERRLSLLTAPAVADAVADIKGQLAFLVPPSPATAHGPARLVHVVRYLKAVGRRLDKLPAEAARDLGRQQRVQAVLTAVREVAQREAGQPGPAQRGGSVVEARWMVEELRVSLWAQTLGTAHPVSEERIYRALDRP